MHYQDTYPQLFYLRHIDLFPLVSAMAEEPVARFSIIIEQTLTGCYGYCADKCIPTFRYCTTSGRIGTCTPFVKAMRWGIKEAHHYNYLSAHNIPVPHLYGCLQSEQHEEILFMELLQPLPVDPHTNLPQPVVGETLEQLLRILAQINAHIPEETHLSYLSQHGPVPTERWSATVEQVWHRGKHGELGEEITRFCQDTHMLLPALQRAIGLLAKQYLAMPSGLLHSDACDQNFGWRLSQGELVLFDLHKLALGPRFLDVASRIWTLEITPQERIRRANLYLACYKQYRPGSVTLEEFLRETQRLALGAKFAFLRYALEKSLNGEVDWTSDREEGRKIYREWLLHALQTIVHYVTLGE